MKWLDKIKDDLRKLNRWNAETITQLKIDEGSIANIVGLPPDIYETYKTVWEMSMKSIIAHAVGYILASSVKSDDIRQIATLRHHMETAFKDGIKQVNLIQPVQPGAAPPAPSGT